MLYVYVCIRCRPHKQLVDRLHIGLEFFLSFNVFFSLAFSKVAFSICTFRPKLDSQTRMVKTQMEYWWFFFSWCIIFDYLFAWELFYSSSLYFLFIIMMYSLSNWLTKCTSFFFSCTWFQWKFKPVKPLFYWPFLHNELPQN